MNAALKKLAVVLALAALTGVLALVDLGISKTYSFELVSLARASDEVVLDRDGNEVPPDVGIADGTTRMIFTVRLTHGGKAVSGHTVYVKTDRNVVGRFVTDGDGLVEIEYRCYKGSKNNLKPVTLTVRDENNSVFVFVPTTAEYTLGMVLPETDGGERMLTDDIFYEIDGKGGNE